MPHREQIYTALRLRSRLVREAELGHPSGVPAVLCTKVEPERTPLTLL
jgi:hypothetical protein